MTPGAPATRSPRADIAPPEPGLTFPDMLARAEALRAALRERQATCERLGRVPDETHRDFLGAGFYRALQPRRFGGYGFSAADFVRLVIEIARGCPDTGWVLSLLASAQVSFLTPFPEPTLRELYGAGGDCRVASVLKPGASALPADGGYRVAGAWDCCSGCDVATHLMATVVVRDAPAAPPKALGFALFDRDQFEIEDNWAVFGMRGTGSRRVVVKERVLPANRVVAMSMDLAPHDGDGADITGAADADPTIGGFAAAAVAVGAARGALDLYEQVLRTKKYLAPPFPLRSEMPEVQQQFGDARALVDTAEASLLWLTRESADRVRRGREGGAAALSPADVRRFHRAAEQSIELSWQAVDRIFRTAGTSSAADSSPLGRIFRSLAVMRTHIGLQPEHTSINAARLHFGLPALDPL